MITNRPPPAPASPARILLNSPNSVEHVCVRRTDTTHHWINYGGPFNSFSIFIIYISLSIYIIVPFSCNRFRIGKTQKAIKLTLRDNELRLGPHFHYRRTFRFVEANTNMRTRMCQSERLSSMCAPNARHKIRRIIKRMLHFIKIWSNFL